MSVFSPALLIIGAGPAGLSAAEVLADRGLSVTVADSMPAPGLKFLRAGRGGLNLSHGGDWAAFLSSYGSSARRLEPALKAFGPSQVADWASSLGIETFLGTSGRLFPQGMGASPLLQAWLEKLQRLGVRFELETRWTGWGDPVPGGRLPLRLTRGGVEQERTYDAVLLALGGASWPSLGSRGDWTGYLTGAEVKMTPWEPANCGFEVAWSPFFRKKFDRSPLKNLAVGWPGGGEKKLIRGELMVRDWGIEGSPVYALGRDLRHQIQREGRAVVHLDFLPDLGRDEVVSRLEKNRGKDSWSNVVRKRLGLAGAVPALVREPAAESYRLPGKSPDDSPAAWADRFKNCPLVLTRPRPLAEAISSAGGIDWDELDPNLMLKKLPGIFCAGEMIDWEAPTGGYLLTGCMALGRWAAQGMVGFLART